MSVLLDTSFLLALLFPKDVNYQRTKAVRRDLRGTRVIPAPVLVELFYMCVERMNYDEAVKAFAFLQGGGFQIEDLTPLDMRRMLEIMRQYRDAQFDYTDTAIMAVAERLNVTQVYTFDRRDFSQFRPRHAESLILLP